MAVARGFDDLAVVFGGVASQKVAMVGEKHLQVRGQQFAEAGCRAADVGFHDYSDSKRIHPTPSILCARWSAVRSDTEVAAL